MTAGRSSAAPPLPRPGVADRAGPVLGDQRGFALAVVVFLLFALGVAGVAGYQIVRAESQLSLMNQESSRALSLARAGLERFVAEQRMQVADSAVYPLGGGEVVVRARRAASIEPPLGHYVLTAEGRFSGNGTPGADPARRIVRQQAVQVQAPFTPFGALVYDGTVRYQARTENSGQGPGGGGAPGQAGGGAMRISGLDGATPVCAAGGVDPLPALSLGGKFYIYGGSDSDIEGHMVTELGGASTLLEAMQVRWDQLSAPGFPVDHESIPSFAGMGAGYFPLIRINGDLTVRSAVSGRGLLVVTGTFDPGGGMEWDGIILAGALPPRVDQPFVIRGILAAGLAGAGGTVELNRGGGSIRYHSCNALAAARAVRRLESLANSWWEVR